MSLSRRARKQLIALGVIVALVLVVGVGGNQLRLARRAASAADGLQRGTAAFEAGDYEEAIVQLNRYVPRNRDDADAIYMLAKSRLEVPQDGGGHLTTALAFARAAVDNDPDSIRNRLLVIEVLDRSGGGSLPELLADIDGVLSLDPSRADLRLYKVRVLNSVDRRDDAIEELRAIIRRDPSNLEALGFMAALLSDRPAEFNQWVADLDQQASSPELTPAQAAPLHIARLTARLNRIPANAQQTGNAALAATRAMGAYDLLTQTLLPAAVDSADVARAVLDAVDRVERAVRITRPQNPDEAQATIDRLDTINAGAMDFVARHTANLDSGPASRAPFVLAALEWLWTSDRSEDAQELAQRWRAAQPAAAITAQTPPAAAAVEALIAMTRALPDDQLAPGITEMAPAETDDPALADIPAASRLWLRLASASADLRARRLAQAEDVIEAAADDMDSLSGRLSFAVESPADRAATGFVAAVARPALDILGAEIASASGDTARAITLWNRAAGQRLAWDLPALQLLETYRSRGSIGLAEATSREAMLRGANIGTGLSMIESRVDQYELGLLPYEAAEAALTELERAGALASAAAGALSEAVDAASGGAGDNPAAAETLVRMLRAADELGVLASPAIVPTPVAAAAAEAINARFTTLTPESKYAASLLEVARTGVYGPALERLAAETARVEGDADASDAAKFDHQRILARFTAELALTYQALEQDAFERTRAFAEAHPDNADAQLLFIDSMLRAGEIPPARTEPLTESLDRLRDTLGADSYAYNFAESRRLYASPATRTPEVARQEIISRLDPFVEGQQAGSAPVEVLHLTAKWWELLPGSLERRLGYLRRAQQTSPTAWGIYPDFVRALGEAGEWDDAAGALAQWGVQLRPSLGLRSQRRDLAQFVAARFDRIAEQASDTRSRQIGAFLWSMALEDARNLALSTGERADRLRYAQVLLAAPDAGVASAVAMDILGLDQLAAVRVEESRPATTGPGVAAADLSVAAALETAVGAITLDTPDQQAAQPITETDLPVIAAAAQLIAENAAVRRLTTAVASGEQDRFPATVRREPEPQVALNVLAMALGGASEQMNTRAVGLFYALAYQPDRWQAFADEARSAMLAAAAIDNLTETETRSLVYPLSQLGEVDTAIALQRRLTVGTELAGAGRPSAAQAEAARITDVVAIAEILRDAGRTDDAYAALDALAAEDRERLTTAAAPIGAQALVALLELETERAQTPVTTAFARRIINSPVESFGSLQLAIDRAATSSARRTLLSLVTDELVAMSTPDTADAPAGGSAGADRPDFRPAVASLWFTAATAAGEDDPLRRDLFTGAITRLNTVAGSAGDNEDLRLFALRRKAYCEIELGSLDAGIGTYRQALAIDPMDPATLNNLADALKRRGQLVEAAQTAERSVSASNGSELPDSVVSIFYDTLGGSKLAVGDVEAALVALRTALDLDASNAAARVTLAEAQLEAGQAADAIEATLEPIGPAAEQDLSAAARERLAAVRTRLRTN
jgi:Tfp pilus assembly protein PilF